MVEEKYCFVALMYHDDKSNPKPRPIIIVEEYTLGLYTAVGLTKGLKWLCVLSCSHTR